MCFSTLPNSTAGGLLLQDCTRALNQTTRRRPWRGIRFFLWVSGYQTLRRGAFTTLPDYTADAWGVAFRILWGRKWGASAPTFFNYQTARGRGKTTNSSDADCRRFASYSRSHAILLQRIERSMEVLLQDCTGARAHATKLNGDFFSLYDYQTARGSNQPDDDVCCFLFSRRKPIILNFIIIIHLSNSHSLRLRPLLLQTPTTRYLFFSPHGGKFSLLREKFFPQHCWQHCSISNLPPEGRKACDRGSGGDLLFL